MNVRLQALVTGPVLAVAVWSLAHDESAGAFFRKVGVTWVFFSLVHALVTAMWRLARPGEPQPEAPPDVRAAADARRDERASASSGRGAGTSRPEGATATTGAGS